MRFCPNFIDLQMENAEDEKNLRDIALEAVDMTIDAGFIKPVYRLTILDRDELIQVRYS